MEEFIKYLDTLDEDEELDLIRKANLRERYKVIDHYTYCLCGDGDLMEGISYEALSLAGTLKLNKLIVYVALCNICWSTNINWYCLRYIGFSNNYFCGTY